MVKRLKKNKKNIFDKIKFKKKYFIPILCSILLIAIFLTSRIVPAMLAGSIYNITDLSVNIENLEEGDRINYNINGYNDWRVLSVDKENGTVEVTSNTNVYDLTLNPNKTVDEYNAIFQTEADKFKDDKYVINSRTIAKSDSLMFDTDEEFWLSNVNEESLMTNKTGSQDTAKIIFKDPINVDKIYIVPYIELLYPCQGYYSCSGPGRNATIDVSLYGVDSWTYFSSTTSHKSSDGDKQGYYFYATNPIVLPISGFQDIDKVVNDYLESYDIDEIYNSINENNYDFYNSSMSVNSFGLYNSFASIMDENLVDNQDDAIYFYSGFNTPTSSSWAYSGSNSKHYCIEKRYFYECKNANITKIYPATGASMPVEDKYFPKTLTFGYRPVLTLKVADKSVGKDLNESLQIGDHVKYEANGYRNWKVLSIDKDAGTVDIISGGVVKNIGLYGYDAYANYENILQNEVNQYINGDFVLGARAIQPSDIDLLVNMNDNISSMFWYNDKLESLESSHSKNLQTSSNLYEAENKSYSVGLLWTNTGDYYVNNGITSGTISNISKYWVRCFTENTMPYSKTQYYIGNGNMSYIAGLRPIITLKYDSVVVLDDNQAKKLDTLEKDYDKYYTNEQLRNDFLDSNSGLLYMNSGESVSLDETELSNIGFRVNDNSNITLNGSKTVLSLGVVLAIILDIVIVCLSIYMVTYKIKCHRKKIEKK